MLAAALVLSVLALGPAACKQGPEEHLLSAKMAVLNAKPDVAEKHLKPVLEAQPDNFEAKRLMASVHQLRDDFAGAEEKFLALRKAQGFDEAAGESAKKLTTKQKSQRELLERDLLELYHDWATSLDPAADMATFEEVVQKGLAIDPKKPRLNTILVKAYENHAKKLVEQGKKIEAAEYYEKIPKLYTSSAMRDKAKERASNLRFEVNRVKMLAYFNKTAKPKLVADERYDAEKKIITFSVEQDVDEVEEYFTEKKGTRVRLDPRKEKIKPIVHEYTVAKKLKPALIAVVVEATGIPADSDFSKVQPPKGFEIVSAEATRRDYTIEASIPLDAVLKLGFEVRQQTRLAAASEGEKGGEAEESDEQVSAKAAAAEKAPEK
jgi:hypothetical protein